MGSDERITQPQAEAAAKWWADALRNPKFDTLGETRGDQRSDPGGRVAMAEVMATVMAAQQEPNDEAFERFAVALAKALTGISAHGYAGHISVDYGPCAVLSDAANAAELKALFPWKTHMTFNDGGVQVSYGYGAPYKEILLEQKGA